MYTVEYSSSTKRNEIVPFAEMWLDLDTVLQSEGSQRKINVEYCCLYVESRKKGYRWTYLQSRNRDVDVTDTQVGEKGMGWIGILSL